MVGLTVKYDSEAKRWKIYISGKAGPISEHLYKSEAVIESTEICDILSLHLTVHTRNGEIHWQYQY